MPAYGTPPGWTPPPDTTKLSAIVPTPARDEPLPKPVVLRHPCLVLPAVSVEMVRLLSVKA
jgi:hypothetical protein